jgi:hypothetical protein
MPVFNVQISTPIGPNGEPEVVVVDADTIGGAWVQVGRDYPEAQIEAIECPEEED